LDRLAKLKNIPLWAGVVVHDALEAYLKTHDRLPTDTEREAFIRSVTHGQLAQDWNYSKAGMKKFRLQEHEFNVPVSDWEKKVLIGLVTVCLRNAFISPIMAEMYEVGKKNWLTVEERLEYPIDWVKVVGRMDGCYRAKSDKVKIFDWKTGRWTGGFNVEQIAGYALYAFQKGWASKPEEIETTLAYLAVPEYKTHVVTWDELAKAKDFVLKSAAAMKDKMYDKEANTTLGRDFPTTDNTWKCKRCQFRGVCPGGLRVSLR